MGGTTEVLQEYLVKLGYQIDSISERKFEDGLTRTEKIAYKTAGAVTGLIASVEAASIAFAYSMRKIYFESELAQSSVKNINALKFAGKQFGIEGEAMGSAIHNMAQAMRLNPGLQGLVESFGVPVSGRDISDVMTDFVNQLRKMPEFAGAQYAGMFGIDPDTYHQLIGHMDEIMDKRKQMLKIYQDTGFDPDASKKALLEYTSALDELEARLSILGQSVLIKLQPFFKTTTQYILDAVTTWTKIATGGKQVIVDKYTFKALADMMRLGGPTLDEAGKGVGDTIHEASQTAYEYLLHKYGPRGMRNNNPGNLEYREQAGATKEEGPNGRFAVFKTIADGNAALADQLDRYSKNGIDTIRAIVSKYAPPGENNTEAYISDLSKKLGLKDTDKIDFSKNPELMKEMMKAIIGHEQGSAFVDPKNIDDGILRSKFGQSMAGVNGARLGAGGAGSNVTINADTTIHVTGGDAKSTGSAVAKEQDRVYGNLVRNTKGVLQ